jgi:hypothetical protein
VVKKIARFLWIQVLICASVYGLYQWREYEHDAIEAHAIAADVRSFERIEAHAVAAHTRSLEWLATERAFIELLATNEANWRHGIGEAHLRIIQEIVEDAVTGIVNDEEPLQRLERER